MARIRNVKPGLFRSTELFQAEAAANKGNRAGYLNIRFAFAGLFTTADKAGRFKWRPSELKLDCLPHDPVDFEQVLTALAGAGEPPFIVRYEVDGKAYGLITGFATHQRPHHTEAESVLPPPPPGSCTVTSPLKHREYPEEMEMEKDTGEGAASGHSKQEGFDAFWKAYPNRKAKGHAVKAWTRLAPNVALLDAILKAVANQSASEGWLKEGGKFIPHPASWLNARRWEDEDGPAVTQDLSAERTKAWDKEMQGSQS